MVARAVMVLGGAMVLGVPASAQEKPNVPQEVLEQAQRWLEGSGLVAGLALLDGRQFALACPMPVSRPDWQLRGSVPPPLPPPDDQAGMPTMRAECVNTLDLPAAGPMHATTW